MGTTGTALLQGWNQGDGPLPSCHLPVGITRQAEVCSLDWEVYCITQTLLVMWKLDLQRQGYRPKARARICNIK